MRYSCLLFLIICPLIVNAQNTVGLISAQDGEYAEGYNLIFPHNQEKVLLLDNKGELIHYWDDNNDWRPGNSAYLLSNGNLVKCKRPNSFQEDAIWAGGGGAVVEVVDWEGNSLNSFELNNNNGRLHHDIAPMPDGNILMVAWERIDSLTAANSGRDPQIITQGEVWSEMILEWNPESDEVVWEWHAWDHLVQDKFSDRDNYGNVNSNWRKIDANYDEQNGHPDWLHINAIDYNPVLDQIVVSVPSFNELWVIDHSTTTAEAATSLGGDTNVGGDLVYRWGNPATYGATGEQQLFFQHDVHWVNDDAVIGDADYGQMLIFNNRLPNETSVGLLVNTVNPETGDYLTKADALSNAVVKTYVHPDNSSLAYSTGLSSIQRLPNNNTLLLSGRYGYAYELNNDGGIVWEYRIPLKGGKPSAQGTVLSINNNINFRLQRYPVDYPAFEGKDLSSFGLLEEMVFNDEDDEVITSIQKENLRNGLLVYPNPTFDSVIIETPYLFQNTPFALDLYSVDGQKVFTKEFSGTEERIVLSGNDLKNGLNLLTFKNRENRIVVKVIKK